MTSAICLLAPGTHDQAADKAFLAALDTAERILAEQKLALARIGRSASSTNAISAMETLSASENLKGAPDRMRILQVMLDEVSSRQNSLLEGVLESAAQPRVDVTLEAFVGATHRIRTSLDLMLGCSEEIEEITVSSDNDLNALAREISRATRWVLQYTSEVQDLAQLDQQIRGRKVAPFDPATVAESVALRLSKLAGDASSGFKVTKPEFPMTVTGDAGLVEKCLKYLALVSLSNARGKCVEIAVRSDQLNGRECVSFVLEDQGMGASLGSRSAQTSRPDGLGVRDKAQASDGAGYAVARRLALALGGEVVLSITSGKGTITEFKLPVTWPAS